MSSTSPTPRLSSDKTERGSLPPALNHDHDIDPEKEIAVAGDESTKKDGGVMEDVTKTETAATDVTVNYPKGMKLVSIIFALCMAIFLVALDQTIIAPALGTITARFQSVKDIVSVHPLFSTLLVVSLRYQMPFASCCTKSVTLKLTVGLNKTGLVWLCLSPHHHGPAANVRCHIQILQRQVDLSCRHFHL